VLNFHFCLVNSKSFRTFAPQKSIKQLKIMAKTTTKVATRPLYEIARDIKNDWKNVYFGAKPYLDAMATLNSINDNYGFDSAKTIVLYFLGNAGSWRGETAKRIKAELKAMTK
jgi:hypothetical protein